MKNIKNISFKAVRLLLLFVILSSCEEDVQYTFQDTNLPASNFAIANSLGLTISFSNESSHATQYVWDFGDGQTSTEQNPSHTFFEKNQYTVTLKAMDNNAKEDVFTLELPVGFPIASFEYEAVRSTATFTNTSKNATDYLWDFGDNETSTEENPVHVYAAGGDYLVSLKAINGAEDENLFEQSVFVPGKFLPVFLAPSFQISSYRNDWDWNGLSSSGAPTPPDGSRGAKFGTNDWLAQTLQVDPDTGYTIKFWFVTSSRVLPIGVKFLITDAGDPTNVILDTFTGPSSASAYQEISYSFNTGTAENITVRLDYGDGESRIDLFSIE